METNLIDNSISIQILSTENTIERGFKYGHAIRLQSSKAHFNE